MKTEEEIKKELKILEEWWAHNERQDGDMVYLHLILELQWILGLNEHPANYYIGYIY